MSEPIAAIATGSQIAAIGIVRLSGEGVIPMAQRLFTPARGPAISEQPDRKLCYGRLCRRDGSLLDLCLVTSKVEYEPPFDVNASFAEAFGTIFPKDRGPNQTKAP